MVGSRSNAAARARARRRGPPVRSSAAAAGSPAVRSRGGRPRLGWLTSGSLPCAPAPRRYDAAVPDQEPGDRKPVTAGPRARRLATPPSARYAARDAPAAGTTPGASGGARSALPGPLLRAGLVALAGALALVAVGGVLASTFGLLLLSGAAGSTIGLVLARAAVPVGEARATPRPSVVRVAVALALAMILLGDL